MVPQGGKSPAGVLYVVATPIGNLEDITYRAISVLKSVDIVAAEDTRHTARLFSRYDITVSLISCHEHNEAERAQELVGKLKSGQSAALVSDAGTPSVSDPGYRVIIAAIEEGIRVVPVPGASAPIAALSVSGLPSDKFCFAGFLPKKKGRQEKILNRLAGSEETLIFYESPRRLAPLLKTLLHYLGDRQAMIAREITKRHEEFIRGSIAELISEIDQRQSVKGEITVLVSGKAPSSESGDEIPPELAQEIETALSDRHISPSRLAADLAAKYRIPKNRVYRVILDFQKKTI
ncbi:MAG: 16S rRNA (cytidine(1402)-2'-O)-methyltransferase [Desulfobacteraceae bacterium]|nr:16S rRNA (cytidine(1402)-2'-O)-methyltransferase [Desulfobacteraceae bacterium]MCF8095803.1 16S rRNA (cytidine(1402)-2'-O)-methyltransferase [Desulfobacteraceae bacterium]